MDAAADGTESVFPIWPGPTSQAAPAVLDALGKHARRIVYLPWVGVRERTSQQADPMTQFHADVEHLIEKSRLERTFLPPTGFAINTMWLCAESETTSRVAARVTGAQKDPFGAMLTAF